MNPINQPSRNALPFYILDILSRYTDSEHTITLKEIGKKLKDEYNLKPERHTLKRNVELLAELDLGLEYSVKEKKTPARKKNEKTGEVEKLRDKETGEVIMETSENWKDIYLSREFEPSEVRLLIDGLLFSHHIPRDNCQELAEKLSRIVSPYFESHVRHIYTMQESIPQNPQIFLNIELLDEAIHLGRQVEFSYLEYGTDKKQHPRTYKNGRVRRYRVSPYQMAAKDGRYYLICNLGYYDDIANYRVDRMTDVEILEEEPVRPFESLKGSGKGTLDLARYMEEHIYMFGQGNTTARFRIRKTRLSDLIETFGLGVTISEENDDEITVIANVNALGMKQFAQNYAPDVVILEPKSLAEEMRSWAEETLKRYQET